MLWKREKSDVIKSFFKTEVYWSISINKGTSETLKSDVSLRELSPVYQTKQEPIIKKDVDVYKMVYHLWTIYWLTYWLIYLINEKIYYFTHSFFYSYCIFSPQIREVPLFTNKFTPKTMKDHHIKSISRLYDYQSKRNIHSTPNIIVD